MPASLLDAVAQDRARIAVVVLSDTLTIHQCNRRARAYLGGRQPCGAAVETVVAAHWSPAEAARILATLRQAAASGRSIRATWPFPHPGPDGQLLELEVQIHRITLPSPAGGAALLVALTRRRCRLPALHQGRPPAVAERLLLQLRPWRRRVTP